MSSINFRLYADQIYGLAILKLKDIITPEIQKEEFSSSFKEGQLKYSNIKNIKKLNPNPQLSIDNLQIENIVMNIPNETENFSMDLKGVKTEIELLDIKEKDIEEILIKKRKELINKFIEYAVKKVENKESSKSFIEGLMESLINRALNGLKINISDIEMKIKYKNNLFIFVIESIEYSEENGIHINNISLLYRNIEKEKKEDYVIKKFSVDVNIETKKEENEENDSNIININMSNFEYKLTKNILMAFNEIYNLVENTKYKYIYLRKKKLIQYYRPIKPNFDENTDISEKNKYYHSLWLYAIKSVIKLQKYVGYEKLYLLDLFDFIQTKISKKFIDSDDNNNIENNDKILLTTDINLLKNTKEKVEKKVLDGKKGNVLANAFSFFFGGSKTEEKKELTEEEKSRLDNIYTENEIYKFSKGKNGEDKFKGNPIKEKISKFFSNVKINIHFAKLELVLANDDINICKLFIEGINLEVMKKTEKINMMITIKDIGNNLGEKLFSERKKINENNDLMSINISENKKIKIDLGFECVELSDSLLNFFIIFFSNIKFKSKNKIFKELEYNFQEKQQEKKEDEKEKDNYEIIDNFSISNIPSLILSIYEDKIRFSVVKYSINKTKIEITYNIKDSFGTILENYTFIFNRDEKDNKYRLHLDLPLRVKLSNESTKSIFISYLKFNERIKQIQKRNKNNLDNININDEEEDLYNLNYIIHKKIDIKDFDVSKLKIELLFEKIVFEIKENNVQSKLSIHNFNLIYENRNLSLKLQKISVKTDLMSTMFIYLLTFESPNFFIFYPYIEEIEEEYSNKDDNKEIIEKKEEKNENSNIKYEFNFDNFINSFSIYINLFSIKFQSEDNIVSTYLGKIGIKKEEGIILLNIGNIGFLYNKKGGKMFKIFNIDEETTLSIDPKNNLVLMNITRPRVNINLEALNNIRRSFQFFIEQIDFEIIICKMDLKIIEANFKLNNEFNLSISKISMKNFDEQLNMDKLFLIINDFIIKNQKKEIVIEQKNINIEMITESIIKYKAILNFSDLNINFSTDDIKKVSLLITQIKENEFKFISKKTKHYIPKPEKKKSNELTFIFIGKLNLFNFSLSDDKRIKKLEIIFSVFETNATIFIPKEQGNDIEKNLKLSLERINIISNQENGDEYNILEYKENMNVNFEKKNMINFGQKSDTKNQLEIFLSNEDYKNKNDIKINLNKLSFNLRQDIIYNLFLLFKNCFPKNNKISNKNEEEQELIQKNEKSKNKNEDKLRIYFNQTEINFHSTNYEIGVISLALNKLIINLISEEYKEVKLDKLFLSLIKNEEKRNLLHANNTTDFLKIKIETQNQIKEINSIMNEAIINLAFTDIHLLQEIIKVNKKYYDKNLSSLLKSDENDNKEKNDNMFLFKSSLKKLDFTLVDDYSNNYFPFLNLNLLDLNISMDKKESQSTFYIVLFTYNYIAATWEPIVEKSLIKASNKKKEENGLIKNYPKIIINNILINISDMFIASAFLSMKNLRKILKENTLNNLNKKFTDEKDTISKISLIANSVFSSNLVNEVDTLLNQKSQTNNNITNYTGIPLKIKYGNEFYECDVSSETNLSNNNIRNNTKLLQIYVDQDTSIDVPFDTLGNNFYKLNNNSYFIWETIITKYRQINIIFYSQYIFKNKTNSSFQIKLENPNLGNSFILLNPNACSGIPFSYCNDQTSFNIKEIKNNNTSSLINLIDIMNNPNYNKKINLKDISLLIKLQKKIDQVNTILITSEYRIINCLPCDIFITSNNINNQKIKKCSQFLLDFSDDNTVINLGIKVGLNNCYYCNLKLDLLFAYNNNRNEDKKYLMFKNRRGQSLNLEFKLKNKESYKGLIIYSNYILYNDSGIDFKFEENIIFKIAKNIYIISNNINLKDESLTLFTKSFDYSQSINLQQMVTSFPYYKLYLNRGNITNILPITKKLSSISIKNNPTFKPGIFSMIFYILPPCKITNLFMNKKLIIKNFENENESITIPPLNQVSFDFFNKNRNNLYLELSFLGINETKTDRINILNTLNTGIYTFYSKNEFYNLEIKDSTSEGNINIFITEANLHTSKIVVINKTDIKFEIYQNKYEKYKQKINENESQILIIHDQINTDFIAKINGSQYKIKFIHFKEEFEIIGVGNDYVLMKESNGVKMKITLLHKKEIEKINEYENSFYLDFIIDNCYISIIGDNYNKNKNLRNYERYEILLFYIKNINSRLNINQNISIKHKNNLNFSISLQNLEIYDQLSKKGKYACIFKNLEEPFFIFNQDLDLYKEDKIAKINSFNLILNKQKLFIEPIFMVKLLDFIDNISSRIGKINLFVDKIFLRTDKNIRDILVKNNFQKYEISQKLICFGSKFNFPEINLEFEISEQNLENILENKFGIPCFFAWVLLGLSKQNQNIHFEKAEIEHYFGDFTRLFQKALEIYSSNALNIGLVLGLKGIWGQIKNYLFGLQSDLNSVDVVKNRIRYPRAFYGKYLSIGNYNEQDAKIIEIINGLYKGDFREIYCDHIICSRKYIFYFSGESLFIFTHSFELYYKIEYYTVDSIYNEDENLIIKFKEENGEDNPPSVINCEEEELAEKIKEYFEKYLDK